MKTYNYDVYCNKNLSTFLTERVTAVCEESNRNRDGSTPDSD